MKLSPRKKAVKYLDTIFSRYIRARDNFVCYTCGKQGSDKDGIIHCGHMFTRAAYSTRWNPDNARAQCSACNLRNEYDPNPFLMKYIQENGYLKYEILYAIHKKPYKISTHEMEVLARYYKQETDGP